MNDQKIVNAKLLRIRQNQVRHAINLFIFTLYALVLHLFAQSFPTYPKLLLIVIIASLFISTISAISLVLIMIRMVKINKQLSGKAARYLKTPNRELSDDKDVADEDVFEE